jgi:hypothetical protein
LDQINAFKPANLPDSKSLTLSFSSKQIGRFKTVFRPQLRFHALELFPSGARLD